MRNDFLLLLLLLPLLTISQGYLLWDKKKKPTCEDGLSPLQTPELLREYLQFSHLNEEAIEILYNKSHTGPSFCHLSDKKLENFGLKGGPRLLCREIKRAHEIDPAFFSFVGNYSSFVRDYGTVETAKRQFGRSGQGDMEFQWPSGMAVDQFNRTFVVDGDNHRVQCFDSNGAFLFKFGSFGEGQGEFKQPRDVAIDYNTNRVIVADTFNHRIQVFNSNGHFLFSFGSEGDKIGELNEPWGVDVDREGNIYVSDTNNHRVQVFDKIGTYIYSFGPREDSEQDLKHPWGIKILHNQSIVVSDKWSRAISLFNHQGHFLGLIGESQLINPLWFFNDYHDNILVVDNRLEEDPHVLAFSKEGTLIKKFGQGFFNSAFGVVMNRKGEILVSGEAKDGQWRILVF